MNRFGFAARVAAACVVAGALPVGCGAQSLGCAPSAAEGVVERIGSQPQASIRVAQTLLDGATIPQFVDPLPTFTGHRVSGVGTVSVDMVELQQPVLPASIYAGLPAPFNAGTRLWGYDVNHKGPHWPGVTIEARQNVATRAVYTNNLRRPDGTPPVLQQYLTQDLTFHWADPIGTSKNNGCVQGDENGGLTDAGVLGGTQNAYDPGGPCAQPYAGPVPTVPHLHGAEVLSAFDGHPDAWFTPGLLQKGPGFVSNVYQYPNRQEATALWFHDHALGSTRLNVLSGLAAVYLIRDARDTGLASNPITLPGGALEQEMVIADRIFDTNGQLLFPDGSLGANNAFNGYNNPPGNPNLHPFAIPEFFGDVITVNGRSWPHFEVQPRRYRFRILNASNARFYSMQLSQEATANGQFTGIATRFTDPAGVGVPGPHLWQIGSDGGLLDAPTDIDALASPNTTALLNTTPDPPHLFMAPAERADIIIDFGGQAGKRFILTNTAVAPFPNGGAVTNALPPPALQGAPNDPAGPFEVVSQVMEFRVELPLAGQDTSFNPAGNHPALRAQPIPNLRDQAQHHPDVRRQLVLDEVEDVTTGAPVEVMENNSHWNGRREGSSTVIPGSASNGHGLSTTELPQQGATELWEVANMTPDTHPLHIHLIQFQVIDVQPFLTEYGLCHQFTTSSQDFSGAQEYRAAWDALFPGGTFNGFTFAPHRFIPGYGPPGNYATKNGDGALGGNLAFGAVLNGVASAFVGPAVPPAARDAGWKDTFKMFPCAVTRLAVRWAPQAKAAGSTHAGTNYFPFDPTEKGPGYVWHCHILDHEDNEMMRPMLLSEEPQVEPED